MEIGRPGGDGRAVPGPEMAGGAFGEMTHVRRRHAAWTIAACDEVMHHAMHDRDRAAELAAVPELWESWKEDLRARVQ